MYAKSLQLCPTLQTYGLEPARLLAPWDFPDENTEAGWYTLLHGIFSTKESNLHLLSLLKVKMKVAQSCATLILQARIPEWVAFPFSRESSQPRDWTLLSHIASQFFTSWATRGAQEYRSGLAYPSSKGSSQTRNQTKISCLAGGFFTSWAIREAKKKKISCIASKFFTTSATWKPVKNWWYFLLIHGRLLCFITIKCIEYITEIRTKETFFGLGASGSFFNPKPSTKCHKEH